MRKFSHLVWGMILIIAGLAGLILYDGHVGSCPLTEGSMGRMGHMGMMSRMMGMRGMMQGMRGGMMSNMDEIDRKTTFSSQGEKIYYRGIGSDGEFIKNSHGMEGAGCAMCHGADGKGMKMMMMDVPPLTWQYLTDPRGHVHPDGRTHPPFTEESMKSCILAGIDPSGNSLDTMMPRWQMSAEDLDHLIEYLKTI